MIGSLKDDRPDAWFKSKGFPEIMPRDSDKYIYRGGTWIRIPGMDWDRNFLGDYPGGYLIGCGDRHWVAGLEPQEHQYRWEHESARMAGWGMNSGDDTLYAILMDGTRRPFTRVR